jgi:hypothetical protein
MSLLSSDEVVITSSLCGALRTDKTELETADYFSGFQPRVK